MMQFNNRDLYLHADLAPILNPQRVAIVGISPSPKGAGARALGQLRALGFEGAIDLVNAKYPEIEGMECHRSIASLESPPDIVIVTVPQVAVEDVLLDAVAGRARAAIIFAAGYADTGREELRRQQGRLSSIALESGIKIIGPNCLGAVNYAVGAALTYTNTPVLRSSEGEIVRPHARSVGLVSQSGGLGFAAAQAVQRGASISHILTSGNSCDVDVADYIAYLAEEPSCSAIACVFEAIPDARRLQQAAQIALRAGKPVIVHKLGSGSHGAEAAMTHSGMLAGAHDAFLATFEQAGMVVVDEFEALIETAAYFAKADPRARGDVVVLTSSGGASVMAADKAELNEIELPQPGDELRDALQATLPDFGTARNPCDVTGGLANNLEGYLHCVDLMLADPAYSTLVTAHPYSVHTANRVNGFSQLAAKHDKRVCNVWITEYLAGSGLIEAERDERQAVFRSMTRCFETIAAQRQWGERRNRILARPAGGGLVSAAAQSRAAVLIARASAGTLAEREAKAVLAEYGVPVVGETLAATPEEAADAAERLGFPVVIKIDSADILHKTEAGAVMVGLADRDAVVSAAETILANVARHAPGARIEGLLVQPMIAKGVEVMIGSKFDPLCGPMLIVGLGGVFVELLKDVALAPAPVSAPQALDMLASLKASALLDGFRGAPAVNRSRLAEAIARVSELVADQGPRIASLDINPVICGPDGVVAVDALIVLDAEVLAADAAARQLHHA